MSLTLNLEKTKITQKDILKYKSKVDSAHKELKKRAKDEEDYVGWLELLNMMKKN